MIYLKHVTRVAMAPAVGALGRFGDFPKLLALLEGLGSRGSKYLAGVVEKISVVRTPNLHRLHALPTAMCALAGHVHLMSPKSGKSKSKNPPAQPPVMA